MSLSLSISQLNATYHCRHFLRLLGLMSGLSLILHHIFQLLHSVRLVIVAVKACSLFVCHLPRDELFAFFSPVEQVRDLLLEVCLKVRIVGRRL